MDGQTFCTREYVIDTDGKGLADALNVIAIDRDLRRLETMGTIEKPIRCPKHGVNTWAGCPLCVLHHKRDDVVDAEYTEVKEQRKLPAPDPERQEQ